MHAESMVATPTQSSLSPAPGRTSSGRRGTVFTHCPLQGSDCLQVSQWGGGLSGADIVPRGLTSVRLGIKERKPTVHHRSSPLLAFENGKRTLPCEVVRSSSRSRRWVVWWLHRWSKRPVAAPALKTGKRTEQERSGCLGRTGHVGGGGGSGLCRLDELRVYAVGHFLLKLN